MAGTPVISGAIPNRFLALPGVRAVIEFGSSARDPARFGDLDVLVVLEDPEDRDSVLDLADELSRRYDIDVSPTLLTRERLRERVQRMPSFGIHLREEGHLSGEPAVVEEVRELLDSLEITPAVLERELRDLQRRLARLADTKKLGGHYVTALGRLYGIGRAACILRLLAEGEREYDWRRAFSLLSELEPSLRPELTHLASLRPFFEALDGRRVPAEQITQAGERDLQRSVEAAASLLDA